MPAADKNSDLIEGKIIIITTIILTIFLFIISEQDNCYNNYNGYVDRECLYENKNYIKSAEVFEADLSIFLAILLGFGTYGILRHQSIAPRILGSEEKRFFALILSRRNIIENPDIEMAKLAIIVSNTIIKYIGFLTSSDKEICLSYYDGSVTFSNFSKDKKSNGIFVFKVNDEITFLRLKEAAQKEAFNKEKSNEIVEFSIVAAYKIIEALRHRRGHA